MGSAEADLAEDALTGEQLGAEADNKAEHGQTAIPGFGKSDKAEAGGWISHGCFELFRELQQYVKSCDKSAHVPFPLPASAATPAPPVQGVRPAIPAALVRLSLWAP